MSRFASHVAEIGGPSAADLAGKKPLRREVPAWLLSLALHGVVVVTLGLTLQVTPRGADLEPERSGGIVLVQASQGQQEYLSEGDLDNSSTQSASASAVNPLPAPHELPVDMAGALPSLDDLTGGGPVDDGLPQAEDFTEGLNRSNRADGKQARTGVFGLTGTGSRFVYVFDRSGSMDGFQGRPFAAAKAELIASLQPLEATHQFQIIFYNHLPWIFNPNPSQAPRMAFGDTPSKRLAENFIRGVIADGGTRHMEPLKMALRMQPDVIFFLTDADQPVLSPGELAELRRLNQRVGAVIHTIEFGVGSYRGGENFLVKLSRENGGQHAYVDVSRLPSRR